MSVDVICKQCLKLIKYSQEHGWYHVDAQFNDPHAATLTDDGGSPPTLKELDTLHRVWETDNSGILCTGYDFSTPKVQMEAIRSGLTRYFNREDYLIVQRVGTHCLCFTCAQRCDICASVHQRL